MRPEMMSILVGACIGGARVSPVLATVISQVSGSFGAALVTAYYSKDFDCYVEQRHLIQTSTGAMVTTGNGIQQGKDLSFVWDSESPRLTCPIPDWPSKTGWEETNGGS